MLDCKKHSEHFLGGSWAVNFALLMRKLCGHELLVGPWVDLILRSANLVDSFFMTQG